MNKIISSLEGIRNKIERIRTEVDIEGGVFMKNHTIVYVIKGEATFSYSYKNMGKISSGKMVFLPMGSQVNYTIRKDSQFIIFRLKEKLELFECCKRIGIEREISDVEHASVLAVSKSIRLYMENLDSNLSFGIANDEYYLDLKINELLFLIGALYSKEELEAFLGETIYKETAFSAFVWKHYHLYNTVIEFAEAMNYTVSGFEKRFKKVFGIAPYKWMREQKSKRIYQDVCFGKYNFKQIADKYNFSSTSTFNDFYKLNFGETPGAARRKKELREV